MKSVITTIAIASAALSMNAFATSAMNNLSIESIKQTLTKDQIEVVLNKWKNERLTDIKSGASLSTGQIPAGSRDQMLRAQVEYEYQKIAKSLGL